MEAILDEERDSLQQAHAETHGRNGRRGAEQSSATSCERKGLKGMPKAIHGNELGGLPSAYSRSGLQPCIPTTENAIRMNNMSKGAASQAAKKAKENFVGSAYAHVIPKLPASHTPF